MLLQGFTVDRKAIGQAIDAALEPEKSEPAAPLEKSAEDRVIGVPTTGAESGGNVSASDHLRAKVLLAAMQDSSRIMQDRHAQPYVAELLALTRAQQQLPGRKTLIDFTQGVYTDSHGGEMLRSIIDAANRAGVTIYTVDLTAYGNVNISAGTDASTHLIDGINRENTPGFGVQQSFQLYGQVSTNSTAPNFANRALMLGVNLPDYSVMSPGERLAKSTEPAIVAGVERASRRFAATGKKRLR